MNFTEKQIQYALVAVIAVVLLYAVYSYFYKKETFAPYPLTEAQYVSGETVVSPDTVVNSTPQVLDIQPCSGSSNTPVGTLNEVFGTNILGNSVSQQTVMKQIVNAENGL